MSGPGDSFWAGLPLGSGVALLQRDGNGLAALNKPAGVRSHPNEPGIDAHSLLRADYDLEEECYRWAGGRLWLLNRLDAATSGVLLAAADGELAAAVRARFKERGVRKLYRALVFGRPGLRPELWRDRLAVEKRGGQIRTGAGGGVPAESAVRVVRTGGQPIPLALLELEPRTGRSHQLRVQCARRHLPIAGDQTYGDFRLNREFARRAGTKRLFLHSLETSFRYEFRGSGFSFSAQAPQPPEFEAAL
ncbi:MAG TPA: RNA pseudouridine synthase [Opitutaceae bacterium]|nr:RNA pseudouridine synthase [Opitutaceae bacterium]